MSLLTGNVCGVVYVKRERGHRAVFALLCVMLNFPMGSPVIEDSKWNGLIERIFVPIVENIVGVMTRI